jgi:DNA-directed RNA polymerase subunit delta
MLAIQGLKCIYDTTGKGWSIELVLRADGEDAVRRFDVDGPDDAELLIEAFEDSSASAFDPETGEIVFGYEYLDLDEEDEEDDEGEGEDEEAEESEEDDEASEEGEKPKG